jgi:putative thioredoxin
MIDTSLPTFESDVIEASMEAPVLLEFWAPWCEPSREMGPVLERLERELGGRYRLVRANADENEELLASFQLEAIPHVVAFVGGNAVAQFAGAQPEGFLRAFIERLVPDPSGLEYRCANNALTLGQQAIAEKHLRTAIALDPANDAARLDLIGILLGRGDLPGARAHFGVLSKKASGCSAYGITRDRLETAELASLLPPADLLERRIELDASDLESRAELAEIAIAHGDYQAAMEQLLEIARRDRTFRDDIGRRRLLEVFEMAAGTPELVAEYRARLSAVIF